MSITGTTFFVISSVRDDCFAVDDRDYGWLRHRIKSNVRRNLTTYDADENDYDHSDHDEGHYGDDGGDDLQLFFCFLAAMATTHSKPA